MKYKHELHDTLWLIALQGLNYVMPLLVWPYLMVVLGAEKFGYIGFATAVCQYLMIVVDFGFNFTAAKEVALHKDDKKELNRIFSAVLIDKLYLLVVAAVIVCVLTFVPKYIVYAKVLWVMFILVIANTFNFVWLFQGLGQIRKISIVNTICKLLVLPLTFIYVKCPDDYLSAALIQVAVYVLAALVVLFYLHKCSLRFVCVPLKEQAVFLKDAFPVFVSNASSGIYSMLFAVVLAYFVLPDEVGRYTAVEKMMRSISYLLLFPLTQAFFPKVSVLSREDAVQGQYLVKKLLVSGVFIGTLLGLTISIAAVWLCDFLGDTYRGADSLIWIMSCLPLLVAISGICGQLGLLALGGTSAKLYYRNAYMLGIIVAFVSVVITVPKCGAYGAAVSLVLTEIVVSFFMLIGFLIRKRHDI